MRKWLQTVPLLAFAGIGYAAQAPFHTSTFSQTTEWDLHDRPNVNSTENLIFASASGFLQHWANTRYRNGHNLVPGTVAPGTLLYHGRGDSSLPSGPEWTATDPEHSLMFCRGTTKDGCWHLTVAATRPLRVLYFDGNSAANMADGPLDSQDVVAWGMPQPDRFFRECERIRDLCAWGKEFGLDGFVRMEMDFEIMLCDFTNGVETVSMLNLRADQWRGPFGGRPGPPPPNPNTTTAESHDPIPHAPEAVERPTTPGGMCPGSFKDRHDHFLLSKLPIERVQDVVISGKWHDRYPGEQRIQLDYSKLVSFYDTELVPSLVEQRFGKRRLEHRLSGISEEDSKYVREKLEEVINGEFGAGGSGVDWPTLMHITIDRFAARLEDLQYYLNATSPSVDNAFKLLKLMTHPYWLHTANPPSPLLPLDSDAAGLDASKEDFAWAEPVYELCATTHTAHLLKLPNLTRSEELLLNATRAMNKEICRVIVRLWAEGYEAGLDAPPSELLSEQKTREIGIRWKRDVEDLMAWLDWTVWLKCKPACVYESICYLPTWPYFNFGRWRGPGRRRPGKPNDGNPNDQDRKDPQPRCVRRMDGVGL